MAKQVAEMEAKPGVIARVKEFYHEVMTEMTKVTWPSQDELKTSTSVVLLLLVLAAAIIYFYDFVFQVVVIGLFKLA
jgi:preprotein translocase subunit SecE